ncbi:MAG: hypothetical protein D3910_19200 [Candidatus Electrothrix sp. ATG2]|nr:hypothetical protein [Candidatus Electrothrix sp. ATG2]
MFAGRPEYFFENYGFLFTFYMKVPGNSLELHDKLSSFVVSPPKGGEMGVYMMHVFYKSYQKVYCIIF